MRLQKRLLKLKKTVKRMKRYPFAELNIRHAIDCLRRGNLKGTASWMRLATRRMKNNDNL